MKEIILNYIAEDIDFTSKTYIEKTIKLLSEGATIPFMARYRKEVTNNLDEDQLRTIESKLEYYTEIEKRKETILSTISEQGKLTPELKDKITKCKDKTILEDLYLPYKPKKRTRATIAKEKGLEPLAIKIFNQDVVSGSKDEILQPFVNPEKEVNNVKEALAGALDIIAENISDNADIRNWVRNNTFQKGTLKVKLKKGASKENTKYEMYYDFFEQVKNIPSHRMLAINRGVNEKILSAGIEVDTEPVINFMRQRIVTNKNCIFKEDIFSALEDSYKRLISPSIESEILNNKKIEADEEAINVFSKNLRSLLLASPAGSKVTMGVDPGFRTGCKVVVVDSTGAFKEYKAIFPHPPQNETERAGKTLLELIEKYNVELIAFGNGTASRETDVFLSNLIKKHNLKVTKVIVNEAGASIYSASETAKKEFPDLDVTVRGAISIARRLQDPLAELVKIDPKSIGVGQYQHDVNQKQLKKALDSEIESSVNYVGVELNTASIELLSYVSGIGPTIAKNIVEFRNQNTKFSSRKELKKVAKLGPKAFEQCAGFLRIRDSKNPLDNSSVHPESYYIVENMSKKLGTDIKNIVSNEKLVSTINAKDYIDDKAGLPTINDIISELKKPGRDPRDEFKTATFSDKITEIDDLNEGMILEGIVGNVTNFGAFVDIGVHHNGLVHISELANRYVKDPNEVVKPGQIVKVRVLEIDKTKNRIALSMKDLEN